MKLLAINCRPDISYFTSRGLNLEVIYKKLNKKFPVEKWSDTTNEYGEKVGMYAPTIRDYCEENLNTGEYDIIVYGYTRSQYKKYKKDMINTGGHFESMPLTTTRTYCIVYCTEDNNYFIHEMHHALCSILVIKYGKVCKDFMDVDEFGRNYYLNTQPEHPFSNYSQTWYEIKKHLNTLNQTMPIVLLKRNSDDGVQTLGELTYENFTCKTLERPWKDNKPNISCILPGLYRVTYTFSPKFLKKTYQIMNVKGRSGIRIHAGNFFFDIEGCILVGDSYSDINNDKKVDVLNSRKTLNTLEKLLDYKDFYLSII